MTPSDITDLLAYLGKAYPNAKAEDGTDLIWLQHLNEMPADTAREAALRWVATQKWMPTIAEFRAECASVERSHVKAWTAELDPIPAGMDEVADAVAKAKAKLADQLSGGHRHGGPNPCPICGGMIGTLGDQR